MSGAGGSAGGDASGWGNVQFPFSSSSSSSSSSPGQPTSQNPPNPAAAPQNIPAATPPTPTSSSTTPTSIPTLAGPPAAILAAAAIQAPISSSSSSRTPEAPASAMTPNVAARNARAESLLAMSISGLERLTAVNTNANGRGRNASA